MAVRYLKDGSTFGPESFPSDFGFTGSNKGRHDSRNHPSGGDDDYGDDRYAEPLGLKRGGTVRGTREQQASQDPTYRLASIAKRGEEAPSPPDITPQAHGGHYGGGHMHPHGHSIIHAEHDPHSGAVIHHHAHGGMSVHHRDGSITHHDSGGRACGNYAHGGPAMPGKQMVERAVHQHEDHEHQGEHTALRLQDGGPVTMPTGPTRPTGGAPTALRPPAGGAGMAMPPGRAPAPGAGPPAQMGGPLSRASITMPAKDAMTMGATMVQAGRKQGAAQAVGALAGAAANRRAQAVMGGGAAAAAPAAQPPSEPMSGIPTMAKGGHHKEFNPGGEKGKLHRELGVAEDKPIGAARIAAATHSRDPEIRRDAIRAETMKKWHHGKRGH